MLVVEPLTNRAIGYRGHTTPVNCRMADDMVAFIDQHLDYEGGIANRSDFVQHWTRVGMRVMEDPELMEALEWAIGKQDEVVKAPKDSATPTTDSIPGEISPTPAFVPTQPGVDSPSEVDSIHEDQLEALRSRLR
jgi:hypothetical protein